MVNALNARKTSTDYTIGKTLIWQIKKKIRELMHLREERSIIVIIGLNMDVPLTTEHFHSE